MATVKLEGFKELERALAALPRATGKNVGRRALKKSAAPILQDMEANAPVDKGILVSRLDMGGSLTANERKGTGSQFLGIGADGKKIFSKQDSKNYVELHVGATGKKQNSPVAMWQEFGTADMEAQPFGRPAWEANKSQVPTTAGEVLWTEIEKAAKRHAKKLAKGA